MSIREDESETSTRTRILEAATRVFIEKGEAGARMREIAGLAGVNQAMLHYYFRDKHNLYREILAYLMNGALARLGSIPTTGLDRGELVREAITAFTAFFSSYPGITRIFLSEVAAGGENLRPILNERLVSFFRNPQGSLLLGAIQNLQNRNEIRGDLEPLHIALSIFGLLGASGIQQLVLSQLELGDVPGLDHFMETRRTTILKICERGLAPG